ncbi:MAG TPA: biotin/lipoyl-containing protein [Trebonia sp.]
MDLTNEDVADILALLDSTPYDELDLRTSRFRLTLRRAPGSGWTQARQVTVEPNVTTSGGADQAGTVSGEGPAPSAEASGAGASPRATGLVSVVAPLPGTFYRAPRPGAAPFVEVGSLVGEDTVVAMVETMKLMSSVPAGARGRVAEILAGNAEPVAQGAPLMRIEPA